MIIKRCQNYSLLALANYMVYRALNLKKETMKIILVHEKPHIITTHTY